MTNTEKHNVQEHEPLTAYNERINLDAQSRFTAAAQARGKGVAPKAGPWHGAAGLRVKPERAVHCDTTA